MRIAVIITTYNRPDALAAVLNAYLEQRDADFELIVADDGSTEETANVVKEFSSRAPFSVSHVWQEDRGFRAAAIRNRALAHTNAEYIIFTDGDCIPLPSFVYQHRRLSRPGYFLAGNRILLNPEFTRKLLLHNSPVHAWSSEQWLRAWLRGDINRLLPFITLPDGVFRTLHPKKWEGAKTCNLSVWRSDLLKVNGLDESYSGWGLEDSDLVIRLLRAGVKRKSARFATPLLHLWHKENDRSRLLENQERLDKILHSDQVAAVQGVTQYL